MSWGRSMGMNRKFVYDRNGSRPSRVNSFANRSRSAISPLTSIGVARAARASAAESEDTDSGAWRELITAVSSGLATT